MAKTLDDAHYEADCHHICCQWDKELLLLRDLTADTTAVDQRIADAAQRITDLTAQQAAPGDVDAVRDLFFQAKRDHLVDQQTKWNTVETDPVLAPLLYPDVSEGDDSTIILDVINDQIAALDAVWTPGP